MGPRVTVGLPPLKATLAPEDGGCRPSNDSKTPAFFKVSLYFDMLRIGPRATLIRLGS